MVKRRCRMCHQSFEANTRWNTLCDSCWIESTKKFRCKKCGKRFRYKVVLEDHENHHKLFKWRKKKNDN